MGLVAALVLALASGGCSFKFMKPPPPRSTWPDPVTPNSSEERCSTTLGPPIVDTVAGLGLGTLAVLEHDAITYNAAPNPMDPSQVMLVRAADRPSRTIAVLGGLAALGALASAIYGYVEASRCDRYQTYLRNPAP